MCRKTLSQHRPAIGLLLFAASRFCKTIIKHGKKFPFRSGRRKKELGCWKKSRTQFSSNLWLRDTEGRLIHLNLICFYKEKSIYLFEHPFLRTRGLGSRLDAFILIWLKKVRSFEIAVPFQFLKIPEAWLVITFQIAQLDPYCRNENYTWFGFFSVITALFSNSSLGRS